MASAWFIDSLELQSNHCVFDGKYGEIKVCICLGDVIGDIRQEYILTISINKLMKSASDSYEPIHFGHIFNQNITLHIINEVTPERCQPI